MGLSNTSGSMPYTLVPKCEFSACRNCCANPCAGYVRVAVGSPHSEISINPTPPAAVVVTKDDERANTCLIQKKRG